MSLRLDVCLLLVAALTGAMAVQPNWEPTYEMKLSTAFMPCNSSGLFNATFAAQFGLADFDWSNGKQVWANAKPMICEELLAEQAAAIKKINPKTKVFVYRNLVKALPWFTTVREKLEDPSTADWWLRFKDYKGPSSNNSYNVPACTYEKCSGYYHDQDQTPEYPRGDGSCTEECDCGNVPCGEYLYAHNTGGSALQEWLLNDFVLDAKYGLGNENIDGFYFDDGWSDHNDTQQPWMPKAGFCDTANAIGGPTEVNPNCVEDMGLTQQDTTEITSNHSATMALVESQVVAHGGFSWQLFRGLNTPTDSQTCMDNFRRDWCLADGHCQTQDACLFEFSRNADGSIYPIPNAEFSVATFLAARGPFGWLGWSWVGCSSGTVPGAGAGKYSLPDSTQVDYGTPVGVCKETASGSGVFTREWTKASVSVDCNTLTSKITMK